MKVILPMMVQDQSLAGMEKYAEGFEANEPYFLDGPVTERIAVLDFDDKTGGLEPGARFFPLRPTAKSGRRGEYRDQDGRKLSKRIGARTRYRIDSRAFNQVSVLATILKTMYLFEDEDVLGRRLRWAFGSQQLLVIPRAGEWPNAFYQRESQSLQFFYFPKAQNGPGGPEYVYSSLSRDIVAHETAHAILDGIAPDLYNSITPQSLALHEAFADLTAVLMAFKSHNLASEVLRETKGEISRPSAFSQIAEEFGKERFGTAGLRELSKVTTLDEAGIEPHLLSVVASSALYEIMLDTYADRWRARTKKFEQENRRLERKGQGKKYDDPKFSASGGALAFAADDFAKMIYGALDYLPPGEISFADFGRAIVAAQMNLIHSAEVHGNEKQRAEKRIRWLKEAYCKRGIVGEGGQLDVETCFPFAPLASMDLKYLVESDWVAYKFANDNRELLRIPDDTPFDVRPRLEADKMLYRRPFREVRQNQIFFKVAWTQLEDNPAGSRSLPPKRRIMVGTTLVINADNAEVIAVLYTDNDQRLREDRDQLIQTLMERDLLGLGQEAFGPDGRLLSSIVKAEETDGALRVKGAARMLHIAS